MFVCLEYIDLEGPKAGGIRHMCPKHPRARLDFAGWGGPNMVGFGVWVGAGMSFFGLPAKSRISGSDCMPDGSPSPLTRSGGAVLPAAGDRISSFIGSNPLPSVESPGLALKSEESNPLGNRLGSGATERKRNRKRYMKLSKCMRTKNKKLAEVSVKSWEINRGDVKGRKRAKKRVNGVRKRSFS